MAHRRGARGVRQGVLGHPYAHLLRLAPAVGEDVLRIDLEPAPLVRPARPGPVIRHRPAEREEAQHPRVLDELLVREQQRFALPDKPKVLPEPRFIQVSPKPIGHRPGIAEGSDKPDGRRADALPAHRRILAAQRLVLLLPRERRVGRVEENHVNPGLDQQAGVFANHERVRHQVIPESRARPSDGERRWPAKPRGRLSRRR